MPKKRSKIVADDGALTNNPFAALLGGDGGADSDADAEAEVADSDRLADEPAPSSGAVDLRGKLVVRRQKKGQGGKTVTCVEGLADAHHPALLKPMKKALGCGGRVEGDVLILATADHARVADWLRGAGAKTVILGN